MAEPNCKAPMSRAEYRESVRKGAKGNFTCEHCGADAYRRLSGTNAGPNRFCSMSCRTGSKVTRLAAEKMERQRAAALRKVAKAIAKVAASKLEPVRSYSQCLVCGKGCPVLGRPRSYCSDACKKQSATYRETKKAAKKMRRAMTAGAHVERFTPLFIFERDGWRCQICGVSTPKSRRGTMHANAPELDHVQPLSKGGAHTKANTQCACRRCNGWKSDRLVVGQVGLFSSLLPA